MKINLRRSNLIRSFTSRSITVQTTITTQTNLVLVMKSKNDHHQGSNYSWKAAKNNSSSWKMSTCNWFYQNLAMFKNEALRRSIMILTIKIIIIARQACLIQKSSSKVDKTTKIISKLLPLIKISHHYNDSNIRCCWLKKMISKKRNLSIHHSISKITKAQIGIGMPIIRATRRWILWT